MAELDHNKLYNSVDAFSQSTGVPATFFDKNGAIEKEFLAERKFCKFFEAYRQPSECTKSLLFSAKLSFELGKPYIFSCPIGLVNIAMPVIFDEKYCGCVVAGPLTLGKFSEGHLQQVLALNPGLSAELLKIAFFLPEMKTYQPSQIQKLSILLYNSILSCHKNWQEYEQINARHKRQLMVGDSIQKFKQEKNPLNTPISTYSSLESRLLSAIQVKDRENALSSLQHLLEEILLIEGGHFDNMKMRIFELYLTLSRMAADHGASLQKIFGIDFDLINSLNQLDTVESLSRWAEAVVIHFMDHVFSAVHTGYSTSITQAVAYIDDHYMNKLTLRELAGYLYINESSLSKLFRQELGVNFTDYLNKVRIDHSIELMQIADMNLLEIAVLVGFEDQSYFTKIFKKVMGTTPRQHKLKLLQKKGGKI